MKECFNPVLLLLSSVSVTSRDDLTLYTRAPSLVGDTEWAKFNQAMRVRVRYCHSSCRMSAAVHRSPYFVTMF